MAIKPGTYIARAEELDFGITDNNKDYVAVQFKIEEGESIGQRITWFGYFSEKTHERTIQALRYCGWEGHDFTRITNDDIRKNLVQLVIDEEEYEGKLRTKVQWVNRLGGMAVKNRMSDEQRAAFAKRMKGAALSVSKDLAQGIQEKDQISSPGNSNTKSKTDDSFDPGSESPPFADDLPF